LVRSFCSPFRTLTPFQFLISAFLSIAHLFLCYHCRQFQHAIADLTIASDSSFFLGLANQILSQCNADTAC
jgi:hypothetical protein